MLLDRGLAVTTICDYLRENVEDLRLVKPYQGEIDRYGKKAQLKEETFPVVVNLTTPFALVISRNRPMVKDQNRSTKLRHEIGIYVGDAVSRDFNSLVTPTIYTLLTTIANALHQKVLMSGVGPLMLINDGEYLITTDLFTVYEQDYYQLEAGY